MKRRKALSTIILIFMTVSLFSLNVSAKNAETQSTYEALPQEYLEFLERLPTGIKEELPEGIFSSDPTVVANALEEMSGLSYLLKTVLSLVGVECSEHLSLLASLVGLLLLSSVLRTVKNAFLSESITRACGFLIDLAFLITLLSVGYQTVSGVTDYFDTLNKLTASLLPLTGTLYAMGGNVTAAVASSTGLSVFMTVLEEVVGMTIIPFCTVCLALTAIGSFDPAIRVGTLLGTIKKNYTLILTFLMMLLLAMLAMQTTLAARADTLAMRSVKFAAGNLIPVVGGSVSELLRSVSAGVSYLRATVGICAVLLLLLLLLPTLIRLLLLRLCWQLAATLADLLDCGNEKRLMEEFASLCGYLIAAVSICSSVLLLSITLLIRCASAIG